MNSDKLIINAAITGMVPMKADNPDIPITVDEIVEEIRRVADAGASIVHIHARENDGQPTYKKEIFAQIYRRARQICPQIILSGSTSGRLYKEFWQRSQSLEPEPGLKPELGSLTLGSLNFPRQASVNDPQMIAALAAAMQQKGIMPELECFDLGMVEYAHYLLEKGTLARPLYVNILLGNLGTLSASPHNLTTIVNALPEGTTWSAAGIGKYQFFVNSMAIAMGGHVRVGLEDSLHFDAEKQHLATNAGLVERLVRVARAVGREVASPDQARQMIGLPNRNSAAVISRPSASYSSLSS